MAAMTLSSQASIDGFSGEPEALLGDILGKSTVKQVVGSQLDPKSAAALVKATAEEDVLTVCARLAEKHVSSLPVFEGEKCIGVVDFSDAVAVLLKMDWETLGSLKNGNQVWEELGALPISQAIDLSERNPMVQIDIGANLMEAVTLFCEKKLRRALVADPESGTIVAVLSPSAIIQYIMKQLKGRNDTLMFQTIKELGIGHSPVKSVKKNQTVLEAMHLMHQTRHSVVAVVDPSTGALAGSISMSDIKLVFQQKRFGMLVTSCWKYIVESRERENTEVFPFFGVYDSDKLQMVVSKLLATHVHHMYVVNESRQPEKVISFTDVCSILWREFCSEKA